MQPDIGVGTVVDFNTFVNTFTRQCPAICDIYVVKVIYGVKTVVLYCTLLYFILLCFLIGLKADFECCLVFTVCCCLLSEDTYILA